MQKSILIAATTALTLLISSIATPILANETNRKAQRVCAFIDKNASNSRWTRRDETAKMRFYAKYQVRAGYQVRDKTMGSNKQIELTYGESPKCEDVFIENDHVGIETKDGLYYWKFKHAIKVGLQYGGDCEFSYQPSKTVYVTIHHRRGDLINPWSCYIH